MRYCRCCCHDPHDPLRSFIPDCCLTPDSPVLGAPVEDQSTGFRLDRPGDRLVATLLVVSLILFVGAVILAIKQRLGG